MTREVGRALLVTPGTCKASLDYATLIALRREDGAAARTRKNTRAPCTPDHLAESLREAKVASCRTCLAAGDLPLARVETEDFDPFWVVTRHSDVCEIIGRHDLFHNGDRAHTLVPRASDDMARSMTGGSPHPIRTLVHMDEPDHLKYRRITQSWFTQQRVTSLEDRIRAIARASIDRMAARAPTCDFVRDVAIHYPLKVLMEILGVPEPDEPRMLKLTQELFASEDETWGTAGPPPRSGQARQGTVSAAR